MDTVMKNLHSSSGACEEDLCDTCSGDTDDVASLCSWTTDQGDFCDADGHGVRVAPPGDFSEIDRQSCTIDNAVPADVAKYQKAPALNFCQDGIVANTMVPVTPAAFQYDMPGSMPMCYAVSVCYVMVPTMDPPTMENAMRWQSANPMQNEQWSPNLKQHWGKSRSQSWATPSPTSRGYSTQRAKTARVTATDKVISSLESSSCSQCSVATTVILRNLPIECMRDMLVQILDDEGFSGMYNFIHVPTAFQTKVGLGYALLNLVTHEDAMSVQKHFEGFTNWPCHSDNVCEVAWNSPLQGLETHVDRYRNSPLMHSSVPEAYRPVLFENGVRIKFPASTTRIRAPRIRHQKPGKGQPLRLDQMAAEHMFQ